MKNLILTLLLTFIVASCSKSNDEPIVPVNQNPHNLQNLGLSAANNIYPNYPDVTNIGLGDNRWYHKTENNILTVWRRAEVTDDSGDYIYYTFMVKAGEWIVPLKVKRIVHDPYIAQPLINHVAYDKDIEVFKLQNYEEGKVLCCQIETSNGLFWGPPGTLIDKMWIDLSR